MTMPTSRLMTSAVSQSGSLFVRPRFGSVRTTNALTSISLSAIGSSHAPRVVLCLDHRAMTPSSASVTPASAKTATLSLFEGITRDLHRLPAGIAGERFDAGNGRCGLGAADDLRGLERVVGARVHDAGGDGHRRGRVRKMCGQEVGEPHAR